MRHRDEDPVHIPRGRETRHDGVEVIGRYLHRHADAVVATLRERTGEALGDSTYLMGSPMIGNSRVAPLRWSGMSIRLPLVLSESASTTASTGAVPIQQGDSGHRCPAQ